MTWKRDNQRKGNNSAEKNGIAQKRTEKNRIEQFLIDGSEIL